MRIYFTFALAWFTMSSLAASRVLIVLYAINLGAQPLTVGLVGAACSVFPMLLAWKAGKVADRFGARWPLTFGSTIGVSGLLLPYFIPDLTALFICAALYGVASTFYNLSLQNAVGVLSTTHNRALNFSNYSMVISASNAAGPLLAGITIDRAGHSFTFLCVAAITAVPLILLAVRGRLLPAGRVDPAPSRGVRHTLTNPQMWPLLAASGIAQCGLELFHVYMPVYGTAQGLSASAIGTIIAMCAVGGFLVRLALTQLIAWSREEKVLTYALTLAAVAFIAVPFFKTALALSVIAFVFGCGINCSQPITLMLLYARSPKGRSGEAFGLRFGLDNAARLAGPIVFGMIATALGLGAMFWINALMLAAGGAVTRKK